MSGSRAVAAGMVLVRDDRRGSPWGMGEQEGQGVGRSRKLSQPNLGLTDGRRGRGSGQGAPKFLA